MTDSSAIIHMPQLLDFLENHCAHREMVRFLESDRAVSISGRDFFREVTCCAAFLNGLGLAGKHVGIMGANRIQWLVHFCALYRIGAVAVLLSPDADQKELAAKARLADVEFLLFDEALKDIIPSSLPCRSLDEPIPRRDGVLSSLSPAPEDLACILFTSGTTAAGKAVMLSHRAMCAGSCHNVVYFPFEAQLAILPMHHVAGFAAVLNTWYLGRTVCLGQDVKYLYRYLTHLKPDYTLTVPSILRAILRKLRNGGPNGEKLGWNLRMVGCGGARFPSEVLEILHDRNIRVLQSYGATELGGLGFDWEMTPDCADTIGRPCPEIEAKICGGELFLRCDSMMTGYYKDPESAASVLRDGWYATGDLAYQDNRGYLHLTGRKNNLIIRSNGENVSPEEIEGRLSVCEAIEEILVGLEADLITASVYPADESEETKSKIRDAVAAYNHSAPLYRQIENLRFSDTPFPKTPTGKLIRRFYPGGNAQ
ncbi:MAG: acyl--CoA ligase [Oscillospiraceae bacterium]|nr:acyl--CoA ligase [Oscillospiraceae bacterium]